ncbi:unnamed protein product [Soboliphyme baturini]|uniref:CwfJ_C_2 domain-containing protein n=1 Tax=Soboliphyme baturini TaxID=241478 RepID=A0A183IED8_9BILA|nr:unnamed protein product [Soboliphyme baturini]
MTWAENKRLIDIRDKDLRKSVPKGFPYFAVHFGTKGGFAHVIENESLFPRWFGQEVVGGMLDLEPKLWLYPKRESFEDGLKKVSLLKEIWRKVDLTERLSAIL